MTNYCEPLQSEPSRGTMREENATLLTLRTIGMEAFSILQMRIRDIFVGHLLFVRLNGIARRGWPIYCGSLALTLRSVRFDDCPANRDSTLHSHLRRRLGSCTEIIFSGHSRASFPARPTSQNSDSKIAFAHSTPTDAARKRCCFAFIWRGERPRGRWRAWRGGRRWRRR
jgi:hypothetical protein